MVSGLSKIWSRKSTEDTLPQRSERPSAPDTSPLPPSHRRLSQSPEKKSGVGSATAGKNRPAPQQRKKSSKQSEGNKKRGSDEAEHPLNLPPDELRRLSTLSRESARQSFQRQQQQQQQQHQRNMDTEMSQENSPAPSSPVNSTPGAFPETNGTNSTNAVNGSSDHEKDEAPAPPPHKSPASPPPKPEVDAEACKAAGNKFFKARERQKAIQEYTKGETLLSK